MKVSVTSGMMMAMRGKHENSLRKPSFFIKVIMVFSAIIAPQICHYASFYEIPTMRYIYNLCW